MEIKRGEKFQQPTITTTPAADSKIFRRTENAQPVQEAKEPAKQDLGLFRGAKVVQEEKKEPTMLQKGTKVTTPSEIKEEKKEPIILQKGTKVTSTSEIKEEKKTATSEIKPSESISKGLMRPKAVETPSTATSNLIQKGTASAAPKKDEKPTASVAAITPASGGIVRGSAMQKPAATEEKKPNADAKDSGWRKK